MNHLFVVCDIVSNINFHSFHQISSMPEYLKYNVNSMKHNQSQLYHCIGLRGIVSSLALDLNK